MSTVIEVTKLNVRYGDFHALKDLSFQVRRGEFHALLGTNGAGKTSALEVIEGHRPAESGTVRVLGQSPRDRTAVRSRMGIMLPESGFSPKSGQLGGRGSEPPLPGFGGPVRERTLPGRGIRGWDGGRRVGCHHRHLLLAAGLARHVDRGPLASCRQRTGAKADSNG
ncbi:ATP-binding cassette domain-containing protein [Stenotrophomonas sp. NPDC087984]